MSRTSPAAALLVRAGLPLCGIVFFLFVAWATGDVTLRCSRVGSGPADCSVRTRSWLWMTAREEFYPRVSKASLGSATTTVREETAGGQEVEKVERVPTLRLVTSRGDVEAAWLSKRTTALVAVLNEYLEDGARRTFEARVRGPNWVVLGAGLVALGFALKVMFLGLD